jgi:hypothetical protein
MANNPSNALFEGDHLDESDFTAGPDNDSAITSGNVGTVAVAEVGEDGKLSSFDFVRVGDNTDSQDPTRGRIFVDLQDGSTTTDDKTQWRLVARDKNQNRRIPITNWFRQRDSNNSRPDHRMALRPVVRNGKPFYVADGREIVLEVRNQSSNVTVDINDSEVEIPARLGN